MAEPLLSLGLDFGTSSCRALIVDTATGEELSTSICDYASGTEGVYYEPRNPDLARQNPRDYCLALEESVRSAIDSLNADHPGLSSRIVGIGVDTTGSTPIPVDSDGMPLAWIPEFAQDPDAQAWLWKDHSAHEEAEEITLLVKDLDLPYLTKCGGAYSSEWFWSKILHCARTNPRVFDSAKSWVECQDFIPGWLTGRLEPSILKRGICGAGHKAMFHKSWGGLPSLSFLSKLEPGLGKLRGRLYEECDVVGQSAGNIAPEISDKLGLPRQIPVSVGAFDAHLGAIGAGIKPGTLVKIMGTSTCDILLGSEATPDIPGVCGIVPGSVLPGWLGIEAGQSAVGDLFQWCVNNLGSKTHSELTELASQLRPGESGLVALDWNNGNRTILVDPMLSGLIMGQSLHTTQAEIYRALIEATAFGARMIIERIVEYGVKIDEIVVCGGIAEKSALVMQIYADICRRPIKISRSAQTCALGSAICGSVVGKAHAGFAPAIACMTGTRPNFVSPIQENVAVYDELFKIYRDLHDSFGVPGFNFDMSGLMRTLKRIRQSAR